MRCRRAVVSRRGGPEAMALVEDELAEPGPGEVGVRVLASGVAYGDVLKRRGLVPGTPRPPFTPGYDLVGVVERLGPGVSGLRPGDRVAALVVNGANAERVNLKADRAVPVPPGVDEAEALCLVLNYVTAWQMLHRVARVRPGERILVHGAAGGVGTALLELGRLAALEVYGTASAGKHDLVRRLGATPIDHRAEDFAARVMELTGGQGVDAVFDPVAGAQLLRSHRVLRRGGRLVCYGISSALSVGRLQLLLTLLLLPALMLLPDGRAARLYGIGATAGAGMEAVREDLRELLVLLAAGRLHPVVAERIPLSEVARAHDLVEHGRVAGKVVLVP